MDRIDAMKVFVRPSTRAASPARADGLAARRRPSAARSPSSKRMSAAELLHRTTRSLKLSEAGERYAAACRRVLVDLEEADIVAAGERSAPRGTLTLTAPHHHRRGYPAADPRRLHERISGGVGAAHPARPPGQSDRRRHRRRAAHRASRRTSNFVAIRVGEVRRVVAASPRYLARHPRHPRAGRSCEAPDHRDDRISGWIPGAFRRSKGRRFHEPCSSRRGWSSTRSRGGRLGGRKGTA